MKKYRYLVLLSVPLFALWFCTSSSSGKDKEGSANVKADIPVLGNKNVAVLELFTSQGCSSCPAADRLLGTYTSKENTIVLSFHVDYWNRLGWKDPFSSKEYTQRQYNYASALHADVYTPQLVVNGQTEMIGSDSGKISNTLKKIFEEQPDAILSIKSVKAENGKVNIGFEASGNTGNSVLNIALIEKKTTTEVKAGENGGATLVNYNVVRNFKTIKKVESGTNISSIDIPSASDLKNMSVVLFLQEKNNNKISGADQVDF
ncbi:MAG: DUF1223 domain-containing protein [Ginsengibacter sp.]